ncbi:MAG TPA: tandem-95 repeat protein [Leucothrix mucor]|nr:tandem-95 repeat protein [Leucothrix mucor]
MIHKNIKTYKWAYLPVVLSSVAILATQVNASPKQYAPAQQVKNINYDYVGSGSNVGITISDEGDTTFDVNAVLSEDKDSVTSGGLWAGVDLSGDDSGVKSGGVRLDHSWVVRDKHGKADHVNKVYGAYDKNKANHSKATVGFGQETEGGFWEGHVSKGLSGKKQVVAATSSSPRVSEKAYDYGVGASVGTFIDEANVRVRAGVDYQWGDDQGAGEEEATLLAISAGVEKFFQGTPHSVGLDISTSQKDGGYKYKDSNDNGSVRSNLSYRYDFGGSNVFQPDRRYRRVRVEIPGKGRAARYEKRPVYANKTTKMPVYGNKTVKVPYKQLVKSTMELEGQTFFKLNRADLIPSAQARLKQIAAQIRKNGYKGSIRITGNTCKLGDTAYDKRLSEQRAAAVRAFLIKEGFNANHLVARGVGKANPKYPTTPDQDFKNRRVDIEYVSERSSYKTGFRNVNKRVQTGTRTVTKKIKTGYKNVRVDKGAPGTPRVVWRTEVIPTAPTWIKRALHNTIKHSRGVDTYLTTAGSANSPVDTPKKPVANNDTGTVVTGNPVTIDVLANDIDNEGKGITIIAGSFTQGVKGGSVALVDGKFVYTPASGFVGTDSFNYAIVDASGDTATATVTITVTSEGTGNNAVTAQNFSKTIKTGENSVVNVLDGSTGEGVTRQSFTQPQNGVVTKGFNADTELVYTPNAGFTGTDTFTYTVVDKFGNTATATVTVTVTEDGTSGGDEAPVANDDSDTTNMNEGTWIRVVGNDIDNEGNGIVVTAVTQGSHGTVTIDGEDGVDYQPNDGFVGTDTFTYTITDGSGDTSMATVTVTVEGDDAGNGDGSCCTVGVPISIGTGGDSFSVLADGDDRTVISASSSAGYIEVEDSDSSEHTIFFDPDGHVGTATITYTLSDGSSKTASIECYED